jgi:magnesium-transporting ATPase (P-type)
MCSDNKKYEEILKKVLNKANVYSRMSPEDKGKLVELL